MIVSSTVNLCCATACSRVSNVVRRKCCRVKILLLLFFTSPSEAKFLIVRLFEDASAIKCQFQLTCYLMNYYLDDIMTTTLQTPSRSSAGNEKATAESLQNLNPPMERVIVQTEDRTYLSGWRLHVLTAASCPPTEKPPRVKHQANKHPQSWHKSKSLYLGDLNREHFFGCNHKRSSRFQSEQLGHHCLLAHIFRSEIFFRCWL